MNRGNAHFAGNLLCYVPQTPVSLPALLFTNGCTASFLSVNLKTGSSSDSHVIALNLSPKSVACPTSCFPFVVLNFPQYFLRADFWICLRNVLSGTQHYYDAAEIEDISIASMAVPLCCSKDLRYFSCYNCRSSVQSIIINGKFISIVLGRTCLQIMG